MNLVEYKTWLKTESAYCSDCGVDLEQIQEQDYMLQNAVWDSVAPRRGCVLCIGCFEQRLHRTLTTFDFKPYTVPLHLIGDHSARLLERMGLTFD